MTSTTSWRSQVTREERQHVRFESLAYAVAMIALVDLERVRHVEASERIGELGAAFKGSSVTVPEGAGLVPGLKEVMPR